MTKTFVHEYIYDDYGYNDDYGSYAYRNVIIRILILILIRSVIFSVSSVLALLLPLF